MKNQSYRKRMIWFDRKNDYLFPGHPSFTTTQVNLLNILKEWRRLKEFQPDRIELVYGDVLTMKGDWEKYPR